MIVNTSSLRKNAPNRTHVSFLQELDGQILAVDDLQFTPIHGLSFAQYIQRNTNRRAIYWGPFWVASAGPVFVQGMYIGEAYSERSVAQEIENIRSQYTLEEWDDLISIWNDDIDNVESSAMI